MFADVTLHTPTASTEDATPLSRGAMIERHLPLVTFTVNRMTEFLGSGVMEREDAIGYGVRGLISAVDRFDAEKGTSFSGYAVTRIRGAIIDAARAMDMLPRSERRRIRDVEHASWDLATLLGRWPTVKELALKTGLSIDDVRSIQGRRGGRVQSLEQAMSSHDEEYEWELEDPDESSDPAAIADQKAVSALLETAMGSLPARERQIIEMRYNHGLPLRVIGKRLNISESRVSQIHSRILVNLRRSMQQMGIAA